MLTAKPKRVWLCTRLCLLITLHLSLIASPSFASNYFFRTVDVTNGLADNFVRDIVRDSRGYMWFSTLNGLSRYDGYRTVNYVPIQFGGQNNDVSMIRETADSTLWMLCNGQLFTYDRKTDAWQKNGQQRLQQMGAKGGIGSSLRQFYVDEKGNPWVATEEGLYHYDYQTRKMVHMTNSEGMSIIHVTAKDGTTIAVTSDYGVYKVNLKENRLEKIAQAADMAYNRDSRVFLDSHRNLWIYSSHSQASAIKVLSIDSRQWIEIPALKNMGEVLVNSLAEDGEGRLWMGTGNTGILVFGNEEDSSHSLHSIPELRSPTRRLSFNAFASRSSHITCFYLDANNTMWIGSAKLGVAFADMSSTNFNMVKTGDLEDVSSLARDRSGNLWIGFDGAGIMKKTPTGQEQHFSVIQRQLPSDIITSLTLHRDGSLLAGTYGSGIVKYDGSRFVPLYSDYPNLKYVKDLTSDSHGNLWVATVDKGVVNVRADGRIVNYTTENSALASNGVLCLANDSLRDIIYIGTSTGVMAFDCAKEHFIENARLDSLKDVYVTSLLVCQSNILWIGSRNGLWVYRSKDGSLVQLNTEQGMSHNTVRALAKSKNRIWASTDNGLTCITVEHLDNDKVSYKCYPLFDSDGLHNIIFSNNASLTTADGTTLLGCYSGYVSIPQESFVRRNINLHVEFTDFRINGQEAPQFHKTHTISHNERLSIFLSAMVPSLSHKIRFLYRFKGEEEWMRVPNNQLYFASLRSGNYVLQVKAEIPGMMESEVAELAFRVLPPIWQSTPAILFYLLLLAGLVYLVYRVLRLRQKRDYAIKKLELNVKKYEVEEDKIRFFTNISHDLKTPLTLIVAPLEKIRQTNLPAPIRTEIDVAWRNARQLNDLVMELLDFRRLDVGMEKLNLKHGDIVNFVRQTAQSFSYYTALKQVRLILNLPPSSIEINFDENKMRRIITNLLSNAYKYNIDNGTVTVNLNVDNQQMVLSVADTGIGIKDKHHIFDRFVQETHGQEQEGSGLGLHIVKQYVDMMGGNITVTDNTPKGSIFTVSLPVTLSVDNIEQLPETNDESLSPAIVPDDNHSGKPTILVVEDNVDARQFLQRSLDDEYNVLVAANGKEALQQLNHNDHVELVLTDVMMPVMDGIELFRRIRNDINLSHIPVIMLTAKSAEENIISGLKEGAADYITKPFNLEVLRLRIKKNLEWTQNVHNNVATGIEIKPSEITVSSLDEELINRVMESIEANMQNLDYSVVQLSNDVNMTRGHLYKKLMAITGKSPLEFIRIVKIKRGKSLLDQGRRNVSEVADRVGLSPKQFSYYFKNIYGETPSEYLKNNK